MALVVRICTGMIGVRGKRAQTIFHKMKLLLLAPRTMCEFTLLF